MYEKTENSNNFSRSVLINNNQSNKCLGNNCSSHNESFSEDYLEFKKINSLKLFNMYEFFRYINKNFPEINGDIFENSVNFSKNLIKEHKNLFNNLTKTKNFLINLKEKILNTNQLFLIEENLINMCIILGRAYLYSSKDIKIKNLKQFFDLFNLDLEIFKNIERQEKIKLEYIKKYFGNRNKKCDRTEKKKRSILNSIYSFFNFYDSNNNNNFENKILFINSENVKKNKNFNKFIHDDLLNLLNLLSCVKSIHFYLPETENKQKYLFLFFTNFELLLPNIYQINLDFELKISNINSIEGKIIFFK